MVTLDSSLLLSAVNPLSRPHSSRTSRQAASRYPTLIAVFRVDFIPSSLVCFPCTSMYPLYLLTRIVHVLPFEPELP